MGLYVPSAGVCYRYPYQMRHTYAPMMLQAGESVMWVAQQMGHTAWTFRGPTVKENGGREEWHLLKG